jgi:hypothetical protein
MRIHAMIYRYLTRYDCDCSLLTIPRRYVADTTNGWAKANENENENVKWLERIIVPVDYGSLCPFWTDVLLGQV